MPTPDNSWDWYYNSYTGIVTQMIGGAAALIVHTGTGWHGPFQNHDAAIAFYNNGKAANPGWKPPVSDMNIIGQAENVGSSIGDVFASDSPLNTALKNLPGDVNKAVTQAENAALNPFHINFEVWLVRIGEILIGLLLIGVGLNAMTGKGNIITSAVGLSKTVAKVVK